MIPSLVRMRRVSGPYNLVRDGTEATSTFVNLFRLTSLHAGRALECLVGTANEAVPMQTSSGNGNNRCMVSSAHIAKAVVSTASFPAVHIGST